jgi:D-hexose-6-phosphate mutarotase
LLGEVALASQTDNVSMNTKNAGDLIDSRMERRLRLKKSNSLTTVVWNPWREGAAGMKDLGDGEWTQSLCVEASDILGAAINLEPGAVHKMTAVLSLVKL